MKVVLINPGIDLRKFGRYAKLMEPMPCIGLAYLAAILEKNNIDVKVIDDFVLQMGIKGILEEVKKIKPEIAGISCLTPSAPITFSLAREIKMQDKNITIILGNLHASIFADEILKKEDVDFIVHNEGEYTLLNLLLNLQNKKNFSEVNGISYKNNGEIVNTPLQPLIEDLDSLPYPAWHLFPHKSYGFLPFVDIYKPVLSVLGSRGCPYRCTFCSLGYMGVKYRMRNVKKIVDEFEYLNDRFKVKQIGFVDPIFPMIKSQGEEFCKEMIKRGLNKKIVWTTETRVDLVDEELLKLMKEAGCRRILYGIESGVEELLSNINKNYTLQEVRRAIDTSKKAKLETVGLFMIGLPGEDEKMTYQTINFARSLDLDFAKFAITVPLPGSKIYQDLKNAGKLNRQDWENFVTFNPNPKELVSATNKIEPEKLIQLQRIAHRKFYLQPRIIFRQIFRIKTVSLKYLLYGIYSLFSGKSYEK